MNICTKYGSDILIISGSYGGHKRTTDKGRQTVPGVWNKFPKNVHRSKKGTNLCKFGA